MSGYSLGFDRLPGRYKGGGREAIDQIRDSMTDDQFFHFCRGSAMKYQIRAGLKGPRSRDLGKAVWYLKMSDHVKYDSPDPRSGRPGFQPYERQE